MNIYTAIPPKETVYQQLNAYRVLRTTGVESKVDKFVTKKYIFEATRKLLPTNFWHSSLDLLFMFMKKLFIIQT